MSNENLGNPYEPEANMFDPSLLRKRHEMLSHKLPAGIARALLPEATMLERRITRNVLGQTIEDVVLPSSKFWSFYARRQDGVPIGQVMPRNFEISFQLVKLAKDHFIPTASMQEENPWGSALRYDTAMAISIAATIIKFAEYEDKGIADNVVLLKRESVNQPSIDPIEYANEYISERISFSSAAKLLREDPSGLRNARILMKNIAAALKDPSYSSPLLAHCKDFLGHMQPQFVANGGMIANRLFTKLDRHEGNAYEPQMMSMG